MKIPLLSRGLKLSNNKPRVVEFQLFTSLFNRHHQRLSDIEFIQKKAFSTSYSRINPCFTAGKRTGVVNCHATLGHRKTTIYISIVYKKLSRNPWTPENDSLYIYSLWSVLFTCRLYFSVPLWVFFYVYLFIDIYISRLAVSSDHFHFRDYAVFGTVGFSATKTCRVIRRRVMASDDPRVLEKDAYVRPSGRVPRASLSILLCPRSGHVTSHHVLRGRIGPPRMLLEHLGSWTTPFPAVARSIYQKINMYVV